MLKAESRMTVKELKALLNKYDDNAIVRITGDETDYGERSNLAIVEISMVKRKNDFGEEYLDECEKEIAILMEDYTSINSEYLLDYINSIKTLDK